MTIKVECSYQEVLAQIKGLREIDLNTSLYSKNYITAAIAYYEGLKTQFESGEVSSDSMYRRGVIGNANEIQATQPNQLDNVFGEKPPEKNKRALLPKEFRDADPISISKMDWDALQKVIPFGSIMPPTPGAFYVAQELKLPIHNGFVKNITHNEIPLDSRRLVSIPMATAHNQNEKTAVNIEFDQGQRKLIPVSIGCAIKAIGNQPESVLAPQPTDPMIWQRKYYFQKIAYTISPSNSTEFTTIDFNALCPSKAEQAYFRNKMPLPANLQAEILRSPDDTLSLIAAYLSKKSTAGGTNFRYVCNPHLSDFLQSNKNDLALIVNELKVGHCDLLAWYVAAQLRAFGRPAWVASGLVTTSDGSAFNAAYGHSVVITADKHGKLIQYDPTTSVEIDLGYHPDYLSTKQIAELDSKFSKAKSMANKKAVLEDFAKLIHDKRAEASKSPKVRRELGNLRTDYLAALSALSTTANPLGNNSYIFNGKPVSWNALPKQTGLAEIRQVISELNQDFLTPEQHRMELGLKDDLKYYDTRTEREQIQWLTTALRIHKFQLDEYLAPISETSIRGDFSVADYFSDKDFFPFHNRRELLTLFSKRAEFSSENIISILSALDEKINSYNILGITKSNLQAVSIGSYNVPEQFANFMNDEYARKELFSLLTNSDDMGLFIERTDPKLNFKLGITEAAYFSILFIVKFQQALLSLDKRKSFLDEFKLEESSLTNFVNQYLDLNPKKIRYQTTEKTASNSKMKKDDFYLHPDDIQRLQRNFIKAIKKIDIRQSTGVTREEKQTRPYSTGDDTRKINWKLWARTDRLYVDSSPEIVHGISTPVYIIFGSSTTMTACSINQQEFYEQYYITALQKEMERSGREFFVSTLSGGTYFKLHRSSNPKAFLHTLYEQNKVGDRANPFRIKAKSGSINSGNFMLISNDFTEIACLHYLASKQPRTSLHYIHTNEPEFHIYPLLKDEWVMKGEEFFTEK